MKSTLYALTDSRGEIRYVGGTTLTLEARLKKHVGEARAGKSNTHKSRWIRSLLSASELPRIELLCEITGHFAKAEISLIAFLRSIGTRLTNVSAGGEGCTGYRHSSEQREMISKSKAGKVPPNKGKAMSPEQKKKISLALRGRKSWRKGKKMSPEAVEQLRIRARLKPKESYAKMWETRRKKK